MALLVKGSGLTLQRAGSDGRLYFQEPDSCLPLACSRVLRSYFELPRNAKSIDIFVYDEPGKDRVAFSVAGRFSYVFPFVGRGVYLLYEYATSERVLRHNLTRRAQELLRPYIGRHIYVKVKY